MTDVWNAMADALRERYGVATSEHPVANQA
jgi:hypothetical protein